MERPRVLLADDHSLIMGGIRRILASEVELVGIAKDGRELVDAACLLKPDIAIVDIGMPVLNGIDAVREIGKEVPGTRVIFLTMHDETIYVTEAMKTGARGYLLKSSAEEELLIAIREVMAGRRYITPLIPRATLEVGKPGRQGESERRAELSARQKQVLQLIAEGRTAKEIAGILHLSVKTAEFHKYNIMRKLGLHNTAELTKYAMQQGLITLA
jgi:DNA-binding NarL/FixJ family response regulator